MTPREHELRDAEWEAHDERKAMDLVAGLSGAVVQRAKFERLSDTDVVTMELELRGERRTLELCALGAYDHPGKLDVDLSNPTGGAEEGESE